jgi:hypothetical protein
MALLGAAVITMWWKVPGDARAELEDWHSHEHFPERLSIPGFRRASRWTSADGSGGIFVMYELENYEVLSSPAYLERLNAPTPWSTKMMPHHHGMVRGLCRVLETSGVNVAAHALTVRMSPATGRDAALRTTLTALVGKLATRPGLTGAHLARHERLSVAQTTEQKIRGNDREADWVFVVNGYDATAVEAVATRELGEVALVDAGATPGSVAGLYRFAYSASPSDVATPVHGRTTA